MNNLADEYFIGKQFQDFFNKSANSMLIKANPPYLTILAASDEFLKITHCKREELVGKSLYEVFPGSSQDQSEMSSSYANLLEAIETGKRVDSPTFRYEILNPVTSKMEIEYWTNSHEPLFDDNGNVTYIINTTYNLSKQVAETAAKELAQNRLKANEENIRNTVRQAPVGMCIVMGNPLFVVEINDRYLEIIGKRREQFDNTPYWDVITEAKANYEPIAKKVLETGNTYHADEHEILLIRNGIPETVYVDFVYQPIKDFNGNTYAIMIVAIDITDKVIARKELQKAYEQSRLSIEAAQLGTFDMDLIKGTMEWDDRCRQLFGILHQDEVNYEDDFIKNLHAEDKERIVTIINNLFKGLVPGGDYDVEYRTIGVEDYKLRWVRAKGKVLFNDKNEAVRFIGSVLDITDQKEDEQRKNDFIGMVSHELKTPLTSLNAYIQMLQGRVKKSGDEFTGNALEKAHQQARRMTSMINGFLNLSRLESGKIHILYEWFEIEQLIREQIEETLLISQNHQITLKACNPTPVYADRDKIASVISNLLSNAVKYSPRGKIIEVECQKLDDYVQISVKDEGMGIKPQDIGKLFERYYRVDNKHTQYISGFGIGLYLCAEIIQRHNGKIWAESKSGVGSTFYFTLPIN